MFILALIKYIIRGIAIKQGYLVNPHHVVNISAMWIILLYSLIGIAKAMNSVGQYEFFYSEFCKSMSSTASTLHDLSLYIASLVAAYILNQSGFKKKRKSNIKQYKPRS